MASVLSDLVKTDKETKEHLQSIDKRLGGLEKALLNRYKLEDQRYKREQQDKKRKGGDAGLAKLFKEKDKEDKKKKKGLLGMLGDVLKGLVSNPAFLKFAAILGGITAAGLALKQAFEDIKEGQVEWLRSIKQQITEGWDEFKRRSTTFLDEVKTKWQKFTDDVTKNEAFQQAKRGLKEVGEELKKRFPQLYKIGKDFRENLSKLNKRIKGLFKRGEGLDDAADAAKAAKKGVGSLDDGARAATKGGSAVDDGVKELTKRGGFFSQLKQVKLGPLGKALKGFGKRIPAIGELLFAANTFRERMVDKKQDAGTAALGTGAEVAGGIAGSLVGGKAGATIGAAIGTAIAPGIGTAIGGALGGFTGAVAGGFGGAEFLGGLADSIAPKMNEWLQNLIIQPFQGFIQDIGKFWQVKVVKPFLENPVVEWLTPIVQAAGNLAKQFIDFQLQLGRLIGNLTKKFFSGVNNFIKGILDIKKQFDDILIGIGEGLRKKVNQFIEDHVKKRWEKFVNKFKEKAAPLFNLFKEGEDKLKGLKDGFEELKKTVKDNVVGALKDAAKIIQNLFKGFLNAPANVLEGGKNLLERFNNWLEGGEKKQVGGIIGYNTGGFTGTVPPQGGNGDRFLTHTQNGNVVLNQNAAAVYRGYQKGGSIVALEQGEEVIRPKSTKDAADLLALNSMFPRFQQGGKVLPTSVKASQGTTHALPSSLRDKPEKDTTKEPVVKREDNKNDGEGGTAAVISAGKQLLDMGFTVAEHPNFDKQRGFRPQGDARVGGHSPGSLHYKGLAIDVTDWRSGDWMGRTGKLAGDMYEQRDKMKLSQIIHDPWGSWFGGAKGGGIGGHGTHLHLGFADGPGGGALTPGEGGKDGNNGADNSNNDSGGGMLGNMLSGWGAIGEALSGAFSEVKGLFEGSGLGGLFSNIFGGMFGGGGKDSSESSDSSDSTSQGDTSVTPGAGGAGATSINDPNARALLNAIADAEGTSKYPDQGYKTHFSGVQHKGDYPKNHPDKSIKGSTAFGRYQFMTPTWNEYSKGRDMSPAGQDAVALDLITKKRKVNLSDGLSKKEVAALSWEWASIKGNNYTYGGKAQGKVGQDAFLKMYENYGGKIEGKQMGGQVGQVKSTNVSSSAIKKSQQQFLEKMNPGPTIVPIPMGGGGGGHQPSAFPAAAGGQDTPPQLSSHPSNNIALDTAFRLSLGASFS